MSLVSRLFAPSKLTDSRIRGARSTVQGCSYSMEACHEAECLIEVLDLPDAKMRTPTAVTRISPQTSPPDDQGDLEYQMYKAFAKQQSSESGDCLLKTRNGSSALKSSAPRATASTRGTLAQTQGTVQKVKLPQQLAEFSAWTLLFHNGTLEAEFMVYFFRFRALPLVGVAIFCVLSIGTAVSSTNNRLGVALQVSCFSCWAVAVIAYYALRKQAHTLLAEFRILVAPFKCRRNDKFRETALGLDEMTSAKSLLSPVDPLRVRLRRNAHHHEMVAALCVLGLLFLYASILVGKRYCYGLVDPQHIHQVCNKYLGYESAVITYLLCCIALSFHRFLYFCQSTLLVVTVSILLNWSPLAPPVVPSRVGTMIIAYVISGSLSVATGYFYERSKRIEFLKIVVLSAAIEESEMVRRKVEVVAAAAAAPSPPSSRHPRDVEFTVTSKGICSSLVLTNIAYFVKERGAYEVTDVLHSLFCQFRATQRLYLEDSHRDQVHFHSFTDGNIYTLCIVPRDGCGIEAIGSLCWRVVCWLGHAAYLSIERHRFEGIVSVVGCVDVGPLVISSLRCSTACAAQHLKTTQRFSLKRKACLYQKAKASLPSSARLRLPECFTMM